MRYTVNGFARSYAFLRHRRIVVERRSKRSLLQLLALGGFATPQATISCLGLATFYVNDSVFTPLVAPVRRLPSQVNEYPL